MKTAAFVFWRSSLRPCRHRHSTAAGAARLQPSTRPSGAAGQCAGRGNADDSAVQFGEGPRQSRRPVRADEDRGRAVDRRRRCAGPAGRGRRLQSAEILLDAGQRAGRLGRAARASPARWSCGRSKPVPGRAISRGPAIPKAPVAEAIGRYEAALVAAGFAEAARTRALEALARRTGGLRRGTPGAAKIVERRALRPAAVARWRSNSQDAPPEGGRARFIPYVLHQICLAQQLDPDDAVRCDYW